MKTFYKSLIISIFALGFTLPAQADIDSLLGGYGNSTQDDDKSGMLLTLDKELQKTNNPARIDSATKNEKKSASLASQYLGNLLSPSSSIDSIRASLSFCTPGTDIQEYLKFLENPTDSDGKKLEDEAAKSVKDQKNQIANSCTYSIKKSDSGSFVPNIEKTDFTFLGVKMAQKINFDKLDNYTNAAFDLSSLIGTNAYTTDESRRNAARFIAYFSGVDSPSSVVDSLNNAKDNSGQVESTSETDKAQSDSDDGGSSSMDISDTQKALVSARSNFASLSVGMRAFLSAYTNRLPTISKDDIKEELPEDEYPTGKDKKYSQAQLDHYMATRRLNNNNFDKDSKKGWYDNMQAASPATLMRELAFINAEQLYEMHQTRKAIEELNLTMSAMFLTQSKQLQSLSSSSSSS